MRDLTQIDKRSDQLITDSVVTAPVGADERIHTLDILRGLALFGMILVHFHQKMRLPATGAEDLIGWGVWMLAEQKAHGTFAFLFGVGFAILLRRLDRRGLPVTPIYLRRLAVLAMFGVVAEVGFGFSILFGYAYWGVALLLLRRWPTRRLLAAAALSMCAYPIVTELQALYWSWAGTTPSNPSASLWAAVNEAARHGSYRALLGARWALFVYHLPHEWHAVVPRADLALFILGLLAVRRGVLDEPRRNVRLIRWAMMLGALSWSAAWIAELAVKPRLPILPAPWVQWPFLEGFGFANDQWLCLTYVGAIVLLLAYRPSWVERLSLVGLAGRMALTNYMLQVMVLDVLASGYGVGLKLRPFAYVPAAVLLFAAEVAVSRAWLGRYRFGPLEWLWRSATYARWQPFRRESSVVLAPVIA